MSAIILSYSGVKSNTSFLNQAPRGGWFNKSDTQFCLGVWFFEHLFAPNETKMRWKNEFFDKTRLQHFKAIPYGAHGFGFKTWNRVLFFYINSWSDYNSFWWPHADCCQVEIFFQIIWNVAFFQIWNVDLLHVLLSLIHTSSYIEYRPVELTAFIAFGRGATLNGGLCHDLLDLRSTKVGAKSYPLLFTIV